MLALHTWKMGQVAIMRVATVLPQNPCVSHIRKTGLAAIMHCTLFALVPGQELQINCNKPLSSAKPTFFCNRPQARPGCKSFAPNVCQEKISLFSGLPRKHAPCQVPHEKKSFFIRKLAHFFFRKKPKKNLFQRRSVLCCEHGKQQQQLKRARPSRLPLPS